MAKLSTDFNHIANILGQIIINEIFLPEEMKTIKSDNTFGGILGGMKYTAGGILFKLAVSKNKKNVNVYGENDEVAMKSASNDLKGLVRQYVASGGLYLYVY